MARIRSIKPEAFIDEVLSSLPPVCRWFFTGLWTQADCEGLLEDKPFQLKLQIIPCDTESADWCLAKLAEVHLIVRYKVGGRGYIWIPNLLKHQKFHREEKPRGFPAPPENAVATYETRASTLLAPPQHPADPGLAPPQHPASTLLAPCQPPADPVLAPCQPPASSAVNGNLLSVNGNLLSVNGNLLSVNGERERCAGAEPLAPTPSPLVAEAEAVQDVFGHYRTALKRKHASFAEHRDYILERLRAGHTAERLKKAISGLSKSKWHRDKSFTALKYALEDSDTIERCCSWDDKPPDTGPPRAGRAPESARDWEGVVIQTDPETGQVVL